MDWFERLTGFPEGSYADTQARLVVADGRLTSTVNGRSYAVGHLEVPSLQELRARPRKVGSGRLRVSNISADVRELHRAPSNCGALFQVASQFNLLEMIGPAITPEDGVTRYAGDPTQGPACAIAAGAATIYRNYFAPLGGQIGQTAEIQIDAAADLRRSMADAIGVEPEALWSMQNGYALPSADGLRLATDYLASIDSEDREALKSQLRVGLHWNVEVTDNGAPDQVVSQAFCSAMPVSYSRLGDSAWASLARLILEASYEATLAAASTRAGGNRVVCLTRLGGGAFGNADQWIDDAIRLALTRYRDLELEVRLVSYGHIPPSMLAIADEFSDKG